MKKILISISAITFIITSCEPPIKKDASPSEKPTPITTKSNTLGISNPSKTTKKVAPKTWDEWAIWVDKIYPVDDGQGHGPDVGSDEWARALDHQLKISDENGHGPDVGSGEWRRAVERNLLKKQDGEQVVAPDRE